MNSVFLLIFKPTIFKKLPAFDIPIAIYADMKQRATYFRKSVYGGKDHG